jgi:NitT/TauT family transport system permease protein
MTSTGTGPAHVRGGRGRTVVAAMGLPLVGGIGFVALWWLSVRLFGIQSFLLPTPDAVAGAIGRETDYLFRNAWVTLVEVLIGFALTVVIGLLIGGTLGTSRTIERATYPLLVGLNAVPKVAFAPLLLVWLGFDKSPKVVMVVLMCFFPIVLATITGLTTTSVDLVELSRSMSASRWQTFVKVRLPAALPQIFVGLKTAMPLAVIGALVGELLGGGAGLGFVIQNATSDTAVVFAAIVLLAVMSIVLFYLLVLVERLVLPWVRETTA